MDKASPASFGALLHDHRVARRLSQLELSLQAGISARHLSYVETGKARPSRQMVGRLADVLDTSLRDRNLMLMAAGFAPTFGETALAAPQMGPARAAIDLILAHQEPYPAAVMDRGWNTLLANRAARRFRRLMGGAQRDGNILRMIMDPAELRSRMINWEAAAGDLVRQLQRQAQGLAADDPVRRLLHEVLAYPGVPADWKHREFAATAPLFMAVGYRTDDGGDPLWFFTTVTSFAAPYDVTLDELRIECSFPADEATADRCRALFG